MELRSIQSPVVSSIPTKGCIVNQQSICYRQLIKSFGTKRIVQSNAIKLRPVRFKVQASGAATIGSQTAETKTKDGEKDGKIIFVAGATGKVGSRTVRELLKLGFNVRAGVRSIQRAESLVKSVKQMKLDESQPIEKLELVECDLEKPEQIKSALGRASTVICCIGASEKEVFDVTGPYRIDFQATKNLIDAATAAKAKHFILVTSLGTNKFGFPAAILNLFWGVLCWKRKAEEALLASGIPYTIVRPGGMERPTDSYKETHNMTLSIEDTLFGGQVSNLQVAELLAFMAGNPSLSYCKVVEVIAETTAPLTPMADLLTKIPPQRAVPYQPKEPEATKVTKVPEPVSKITTSESLTIATESKKSTPRPLSPYTVYEGLKPPVSPIPTAPGGRKAAVEAVSTTSTVSETITTTETAAEPEPEPVAEPKPEPVAESESEPVAEPEPVAVGLQTTRPLSPYAVYESLKPPTSPTPTPSGFKQTPSSSSPTPEIAPESTTSIDDVVQTEDSIEVKEDPPKTLTSGNSPYPVYDNLKPPTSPTPSSPSVSPPSIAATDNGSPVASTPETTLVKPRPLSPYSMYESLKPPTSPIPSTPSK